MPDRSSPDDGAFVGAFKAEMDQAQHSALVELYTWANRMGYGHDPGLRERAEAWAARIEACGLRAEVLLATTPWDDGGLGAELLATWDEDW